MSESLLPPQPSPTGTPLLSPKLVPYVGLLTAFGPVAIELQDPAPWNAAKIGKLIALELPVLLAVFSPGLRRSDGA